MQDPDSNRKLECHTIVKSVTGFSVTDFMKFSDTYFSELSRIIFIPVNTFFLQLIMIQVIKQTVLIIFTTENRQNGKTV